jgi:predicted ATP-dependent endonuclease of OLD family
MAFWKQNEDLEVEVDIKSDPEDQAPFNTGPNLYLRIKNRRHRGVSTPFAQRSRGFIWFFSFLVWFDSVQHQLDVAGKGVYRDLILLLDEPGLALHALAQSDFLRYIDNLSKKHQVIYTTHSPFMVHSDRLHQVRVVEDKEKVGTVISSDVSSSDPRTIFPLQAALGWTIAQNLFITERNLLVEGPSEAAQILFCKFFGDQTEVGFWFSMLR